jgi:cell division protein FtsB
MENLFYRKKKSPWDFQDLVRRLRRNKRALIPLAVGLFLCGYVVFADHGLLQRFRLARQKSEMEQKIREAEAESIRLKGELKALENDRATLERVAREKHGMVRSGETVYRTSPAH